MDETGEITKIVEAFDILHPYLPDLFGSEVVFLIANRTKFLRVIPTANIPVDAKNDDPLPEQSGDYKAMKEGKPTTTIVSKEIYGFAIRSTCTPLRGSSGAIIGSLCAATSLEKQTQIRNMATTLSEALQQISLVIGQIAGGVQNLTSANSEILEHATQAQVEAQNTDGVVKFVKNIAGETNLLGLNAAIEATRAGEQGRGFGVVATEIRKLSLTSNESIKQIAIVLDKIQERVGEIAEKVQKASTIYSEQAVALQEISASIEDLNATAQVLDEFAKKL